MKDRGIPALVDAGPGLNGYNLIKRNDTLLSIKIVSQKVYAGGLYRINDKSCLEISCKTLPCGRMKDNYQFFLFVWVIPEILQQGELFLRQDILFACCPDFPELILGDGSLSILTLPVAPTSASRIRPFAISFLAIPDIRDFSSFYILKFILHTRTHNNGIASILLYNRLDLLLAYKLTGPFIVFAEVPVLKAIVLSKILARISVPPSFDQL